MKHLSLTILCLVSFILDAQEWQSMEIGTCPTPNSYDVAIADGRNDGVNRLYVTTSKGGVYEWSYTNGSWQMTETLMNDAAGLVPIYAGDGRNDGVIRIYFGEFSRTGRIMEASWNGQNFNVQEIAADHQCLGLIIGDARNDGVNRLYTTSVNEGLREWTWRGQWQISSSWTETGEGNPDIGDAQNDGMPRLYSPSSTTLESSYQNGQFHNSAVDAVNTWPDAMQIARGRNDGINRIYTNATGNMGGGRKEVSWNGSNWDIEIIEPKAHRGDIHVARLKADGKYRVYLTTSKYFKGAAGPLDEYEWDGQKWMKTGVVMSAQSGATAMLTSGDGRNDRVERLYAPHWSTGGIYEISNRNPFVNTTASTSSLTDAFKLRIYPNPILSSQFTIEALSENMSFPLRMDIKDMLGHRLMRQQVYTLPHKVVIDEFWPSAVIVELYNNQGQSLYRKLVR